MEMMKWTAPSHFLSISRLMFNQVKSPKVKNMILYQEVKILKTLKNHKRGQLCLKRLYKKEKPKNTREIKWTWIILIFKGNKRHCWRMLLKNLKVSLIKTWRIRRHLKEIVFLRVIKEVNKRVGVICRFFYQAMLMKPALWFLQVAWLNLCPNLAIRI